MIAQAMVLSDIAHRLLAERRDAFILELFEELRNELEELASDSRMAGLLEASVTENIVSIVNFLERGTTVDDLDATSSALAHARILAQRNIPLSLLFRAYRLGHAKFVGMGLELVRQEDPAVQMDLAEVLMARSAAFVDKVCQQVGRAYDEEREQWIDERGGIRQHWIEELLSSRQVDVAAAEEVLGYRMATTHVCAHMWVAPGVSSTEARAQFDEVRRLLAGGLSAVAHPLMAPQDEREMHAWFPVRRGFQLDAEAIARVLSGTRVSGVRVAIGRPEGGAAGFRLSSRQATRVKEVLLTSTSRLPAAVTYDQLGPVALMSGDADALRRFVRRTLGPLAKDAPREETLRDTLRGFLAHHSSYAATAQAMTMHRNSVQYRVNQALDLCGRDLNEVGVVLDLQVALDAAHWLGRAVLFD